MVARALPATWDWRLPLIAAWFVVNGLLIARDWSMPFGDWQLWAELASRPDPFVPLPDSPYPYPFVWSPLMVPLMSAVGAGGALWVALHFAVLPLLRSPLLIVMTACSWPFFTDVGGGNAMTFIFVAGVLAWQGSRVAGIAYLALLLLMPRPVQLPLALLLLMRDPWLWRPLAGLVVVNVTAVIGSGLAGSWLTAMMGFGVAAPFDMGPRRYIGPVWLLVSYPLAALLTYAGRPGLASVFAAPYLLPHYLFMPIIDHANELAAIRFRRPRWTIRSRNPASAVADPSP